MRSSLFIAGLILAAVITATAHSAYEITSIVYLHSNRIELLMEVEFPTGMRLAGVPPREASPSSQFETALPQLRAAAGAFFQFMAGDNVVPALRTNVELGVENHIRLGLEYASTSYRPLRFAAPGLRPLAEQGPYGVALTVLDLVHQKVVGQSRLFADSPAAEFSPLSSTTNSPPPTAAPRLQQSSSNAVQTAIIPPSETPSAPTERLNVVPWLVLSGLALGVILWFVARRSVQ